MELRWLILPPWGIVPAWAWVAGAVSMFVALALPVALLARRRWAPDWRQVFNGSAWRVAVGVGVVSFLTDVAAGVFVGGTNAWVHYVAPLATLAIVGPVVYPVHGARSALWVVVWLAALLAGVQSFPQPEYMLVALVWLALGLLAWQRRELSHLRVGLGLYYLAMVPVVVLAGAAARWDGVAWLVVLTTAAKVAVQVPALALLAVGVYRHGRPPLKVERAGVADRTRRVS